MSTHEIDTTPQVNSKYIHSDGWAEVRYYDGPPRVGDTVDVHIYDAEDPDYDMTDRVPVIEVGEHWSDQRQGVAGWWVRLDV